MPERQGGTQNKMIRQREYRIMEDRHAHALLDALQAIAPLGKTGPLDLAWSACRRQGEHVLAEQLTTLGNAARSAIADATLGEE
jgi:hypothetical protein